MSTDGTCINYIIKRNNKRYNSKSFTSYEQARSYIRKKLRTALTDNTAYQTSGAYYDGPLAAYSNPSHSRYGFSIQKIAC